MKYFNCINLTDFIFRMSILRPINEFSFKDTKNNFA